MFCFNCVGGAHLRDSDVFCRQCGGNLFRDEKIKRGFLDAECVAKVIDSTANDQPFTIVFEKKDGSLRVMFCGRDRDKAIIQPKTSVLDGQVKVWDREKGAPRTFNLNKVARISIP